MAVTIINDSQRLEELTEWCRNKPDEAAQRIMVAEGLCKPLSNPRESRFEVGDRVVCTEGHGSGFFIEEGSEWIIYDNRSGLVLIGDDYGLRVFGDPDKLEKVVGEWCDDPSNNGDDCFIDDVDIVKRVAEKLSFRAEEGFKGVIDSPSKMKIEPKTPEARNKIIEAFKSGNVVLIGGVTCVIRKFRVGLGSEFWAHEVRVVDIPKKHS